MEESESTQEMPRPRRSIIAFVAIFVSVVLALLVGYHYTSDTVANDWYLFQVARNTAWVLERIGERATLEAGRAPWEAFQERAARLRAAGYTGEIGPRVSFVYEEGRDAKVVALQMELRQREAAEAPPEELKERREALERLMSERQAAASDPDRRRENSGLSFIFTVVPSCGAIEVMAIFIAAILAFPAKYWKKAAGILIGVPVMYGFNVARLSCLGLVGAWDTTAERTYFVFAHKYVWQSVYIIFVVVAWLVWVEYLVKRRKDDHAASQ